MHSAPVSAMFYLVVSKERKLSRVQRRCYAEYSKSSQAALLEDLKVSLFDFTLTSQI